MGLLGAIGGPARRAMVSDILPEKQRAEGYGIMRVVLNISAAIGPALGGLLATYNFMWIFIGDALSSFITAIIFIKKMPETLPKLSKKKEIPETQESEEKIVKKSGDGGYKEVFLDWRFMIFVFVSGIMSLTYMQMNSTLPVFLTDELLFSKQIYGFLLSMNAIMVVVMQFWITRRIKLFPALILMGVGNILYGIGFGMYGFIATIPLAFLAMIILTIGEMVVAPFAQTVAAKFAPEDKRGRYMAVNGMAGLFPMLFGVIGAGAIMDYLDPKIVWYLTGILSLFAATGFVFLHYVTKDHFSQMVEDENLVKDLQRDGSKEIKPESDVLP